MKCAACVAAGTPSQVRVGGQMATCMGFSTFYDELGRYHSHDPNLITTQYSCSNGHIWSESHKAKCPTCDAAPHEESTNEQ